MFNASLPHERTAALAIDLSPIFCQCRRLYVLHYFPCSIFPSSLPVPPLPSWKQPNSFFSLLTTVIKHRWRRIHANANTIMPMAPAATFKSRVVLVPDPVEPGGREMETRPALGEGDTVGACWRFSDDPHTLLTAKDGVELEPHGCKHMKHGYYKVSVWLTRGRGAMEAKQRSLNLAAAAYPPRTAPEWEVKGRKWNQNRKKISPHCFFTCTMSRCASFCHLCLH